MQTKEFKLRRNELLKRLGPSSVAIIFAAKECVRSGKVKYPYRQNSDFYYLTGFIEPESIAVLISGRGEGEFILFNRERDCAKEIWYGECIGQKRACSEFGADQAFAISEVDKILPQLLAGRDNVYFNVGFDHDFDQKVTFWLNQTYSKESSEAERPYLLGNLNNILHEMRLKKSKSEIAIIRKAAEITAKGHLRAMEKCRPGMYEFELEAELLYEFVRLGGRHEAFETIVAGGKNACTLHYSKNDKKLLDGELVLVDAGVEYQYYCSDVSRTFPVNGRFNPKQRAIYEIVLNAQVEVIKQVRPGVKWDYLQLTAERAITGGLIELGLLEGERERLVVKQDFKPFFMHKIGHWLGLDAHDVGEYSVDDKWRVLEAGMVFTVELGIYISPEIHDIDHKWLGIGVRIEDDILVTENGCEVLTKAVPKDVAEIEVIMHK